MIPTFAEASKRAIGRRRDGCGGSSPLMHRAITAALFSTALALASVGASGIARQPRAAMSSSSFDVTEKDITDLQRALREGTVTSRQLVELYLARINAYDGTINAFIALNRSALDQAAALDDERRAGRVRGPLHGIPLVLQDNYATADLPTTGGSLALEGFQTGRDGFQVKRLRDAGAVFIGKTNLHELAAGITTVSSMAGQTRNPYDPSRNPGGSSGGTGAAVTSSFAAAGMGTDSCGSIRIPAAHNNLWGLRPTMGLSSRDGIIPVSHSQDVAGPLARSVADVAVILDATVGVDPADPVTEAGGGHAPATYLGLMGDSSLGDVQIGVLSSLFGTTREDEEVGSIVNDAIDTLNGMGAGTVDVPLPGLDDMLRDTSTIDGEFKFDLIDFLGQYPKAPVASLDDILRGGLYRTEVDGTFRRRNAVQSREGDAYRTVLKRREAAATAIADTMSSRGLTLLAYPTIRRKAAPIGQPQIGSNCQLSATTGLPAMSLPAGFTEDGLPVALELLGRAFSEGTLLRVAYAYERVTHPRRQPRSTPALAP
jgi:Asp-tRNA(Asn)/Glu-tRNA(Gln) amidotransferase A subunit family amidase